MMLASIHEPSSLQLSQSYFRLAKSGSTEERWCRQQKVTRTVLSNEALELQVVYSSLTDYEETDEVNSSVCTNVKGVAYTNDRIRDTAEYTTPMQVLNSFFVMANIIKTENQLEQWCPEYPFAKAICSSDKSCEKGSVDIHSHGIQTGRCVNYNATVKTCKVKAWCPVESMENLPEPAVLRSSEDFTVLIKNNIHFPKFNYTTCSSLFLNLDNCVCSSRNIPPNLNTSCTYNKITSPLCPIFHLGDNLQEAKENFSEVAVRGGIIAAEINWECNLDSWFYDCSPKYSFCCLDDKTIKPGFYFRYARYYKLPHGKEQRTLFEVYGIQFDVLPHFCHIPLSSLLCIVLGWKSCQGRKFNSIELIKNIGSMISCFGLVVSAIEIAIGVGNCSSCGKSPFYKIYNRKKYEPVLNPRQSHRAKFCDAGSCCTSESNENRDNEECELMHTSESNENHDNEEYELGQPLRQRASSPDCQKWCCCGKCHPTQKYHEQLCCRRKKGQCITTSHWFQQLVLSSPTLKKALLYKDPFLDLTDGNINNQLHHLAYKQYIHWRFGSFDLEDRAVIPGCCRWKIRDTYPKAVNHYSGFKME
ncbi:P2X purinoceptor 7 [Spheniscus humboldti]